MISAARATNDVHLEQIEVHSKEACVAILDSRVNLCTWLREAPTVDDLAMHGASLDFFIRPSKSPAWRQKLARELSDLPVALKADIERLVSLYVSLTDVSRVHVQLNEVTHDKCKRFHVDRLRLRLLCTYRGPGTDWVPEAFVDRQAVYDAASPAHANNAALVRDVDEIRRVPTGAVAILKGDAYPGNDGKGIIHRSPPIMHLGARRLVLTIDDLIAP